MCLKQQLGRVRDFNHPNLQRDVKEEIGAGRESREVGHINVMAFAQMLLNPRP